MNEALLPRIVNSPDWLEKIARFRVAVWMAHGMIDPRCFPDGVCDEAVDRIATHFIIEREGDLLGACRYVRYPDLASSHHAAYYKSAGIELEGPIGIPEHFVVHPDSERQGIGIKLVKAQQAHAIANNVRFLISEASPAAAALLLQLGRRSLGPAPEDARFPGMQFVWILTDLQAIAAQRI